MDSNIPGNPCFFSRVKDKYERFSHFLSTDLTQAVLEAKKTGAAVSVRCTDKHNGDTLIVNGSSEEFRNATMCLLQVHSELAGVKVCFSQSAEVTLSLPLGVLEHAERHNCLGSCVYKFRNAVVKDAVDQNGFVELRIAEYDTEFRSGQIKAQLHCEDMLSPQLSDMLKKYKIKEAADWRGKTLTFLARRFHKGIHGENSSMSTVQIEKLMKIRNPE
ncbi:hypothetical protein [Congregibacter litoralis]|nr:hypothetical protein [Congregibacter litoralis]